jgi:hypothetical protein
MRFPSKDQIKESCKKCILIIAPILILSYGIYGVSRNDIYIPIKTEKNGLHFHGISMAILFLDFIWIAYILSFLNKYNNGDKNNIRTFMMQQFIAVGIYAMASAILLFVHE